LIVSDSLPLKSNKLHLNCSIQTMYLPEGSVGRPRTFIDSSSVSLILSFSACSFVLCLKV